MTLFGHKWYDIWGGTLLMVFVADYCLLADMPVFMSRLTLAWMALGILGFAIQIIATVVRSVW